MTTNHDRDRLPARSVTQPPTPTHDDFVGRVMAGVARQHRPGPTRAFVAAVRRGSLRDAAASLASAWRLATARGRSVGAGVRMRGATLVLAVTTVLAFGGSVALATVADAARHVAVDVIGSGRQPARVEPAVDATQPPSAEPSPPPVRVVVTMPGAVHDDADADVMTRDRRTAPAAEGPVDATPRPSHDPHDGGDRGTGDGRETPSPTPDGQSGSGDGSGSSGDGGGSSDGGSGSSDGGSGSGDRSSGGDATPSPTGSATDGGDAPSQAPGD